MKKVVDDVETAIILVDVKDLIPFPGVRFRKDKAGLAALAASLKFQGVINPGTARIHPTQKSKYELVTGCRRLAAAKKAGLKVLPILLRSLTNAKAHELAFAENHHRKNLHPLEESKAVQALFDAGWDIDSIASRHGRSKGWVARRAQLHVLIEEFRTLVLDADSLYSRLPDGVLEHLARLPESTQRRICEDLKIDATNDYVADELASMKNLKHYLADFTMSLGAVPWDVDDETIHPKAGACSMCPKRKNHQQLLFDDEDDDKAKKTDTCLDRECFDVKAAAAIKVKIATEKAKHGEVILVSTSTFGNERQQKSNEFGSLVIPDYQTRPTKATSRGAKRAIMIDGAGMGQTRWVACQIRESSRGGPHAVGKKPGATPLKERRAQLVQRRMAWVVREVQKVIETFIKKPQPLPPASNGKTWMLHDSVHRLLAFGTPYRADSQLTDRESWKILQKTPETSETELRAMVDRAVLQVWKSRLNGVSAMGVGVYYNDVKKMAPVLGILISDLYGEASQTIPEPKSWAGLGADGNPKPAKGKSKEKTLPELKPTKSSSGSGIPKPLKQKFVEAMTSKQTPKSKVKRTAKSKIKQTTKKKGTGRRGMIKT